MWRLFAMGLLTLSAAMANPAISQDGDRQDPPRREGAPPPSDERRDRPPGERGGAGQEDGERRRWDWRRQPPQISAEFRNHVIAVVQDLQNQPMSEEQREKLAAMKPDEFLRVFQDNAGTILAFARLRERTPDLYELKIRDYRLMREVRSLAAEVRRLHAANDHEAATALEGKMRVLVSEQFEIDLKARAIELRLLEERVASMKKELDERREEKEAHVDQRVKRVLEAESRREDGDDEHRRMEDHIGPERERGGNDRPPPRPPGGMR